MRTELPQMRDSMCPTIFAWHGSSLHNWHSILREGLHFNEVVNGRAFGNGVYFSPHAQTSLIYSGGLFGRVSGSIAGQSLLNSWMWPPSQLCISDALSLNEIVNRPDKFQSTNPHLVVAQLDWIQTRYLFVKCNSTAMSQVTKEEDAPAEALSQDPTYTATGASGQRIQIPLAAISKSRRPSNPKKRTSKGKAKQSIDRTLVELSDDTDVEDIALFYVDEDEAQPTKALSGVPGSSAKNSTKTRQRSKTDFCPGTLDTATLPMLEPPSYATSTASKTLQKELTATLKIQDSTPLADLGWYLDRELISNVYQWMVELHSFEPQLPLAKDMASRELTSIVLEIRFPGTYPMAPPFVRVVRPRFLGFREGGGGHVTAGGALCMELLTNSGWSVASNIESVLVQVRAAISSTEPAPARLEIGPVREYGRGEAVEAYLRACQMHGWSVPPDFMKNYGGGPGPAGQY